MKVKPKKNVEIPPDIRSFTERIVNTPFELLGEALTGFSWKFDKGDFHHWIPLLNFFDAAFEKYTSTRADLTLEGDFNDPPFPSSPTVAILRVTTRILENCTNKHLYQSYDHLTQLLAAPDGEVVVWALHALVAFLRRTHHYTMRFNGFPALNARLFDLCKGWGGKEQALDMAACVHEDVLKIAEGMKEGTTLDFEFFSESIDRTFGRKVLRIENMHHQKHTDHAILQSLIKEHNIPQDLRFQLLTRIRVASSFGTLEGRRSLLKIRLLAFCVLIQSNPLHEEMLNFFTSEPEFMNELVEVIQMDDGITLDLRALALRSITVQLVDRSRHSAVINAVGTGGSNGMLAVLLQDAIESICPGTPPLDRKPKYNAAFVEALLVLIATLITQASGNMSLNEAGFIPALMPLIKDRNPAHINLVCSAVKILEGFMDYSSTASALFRGMGGLSTMIARLDAEIHPDEGPSSSQGNKRKKSNDEMTKPQISYLQKLLMKSLLRAIALGSYAPSVGTASRPDEQDARILYKCLKSIFARAKEFGGGLFAFAATVTTDLIHQDPLSFVSLDAAGVPDAFLDAIEEGVIPSSDAVCSIAPTLVAFCLNGTGLQKVTDRRALRCLVHIFTSKRYIKALSGDTGSILGAGIDELFRHVTSLKVFGMQHVIIQMLKVLCIMGGDADVQIEDMPDEAIQRLKQPGIDASLPECVCHTAKMLESLLSNNETAQRFAQHGGVELLLKFYTLPRMPAGFGSLPQAPPLLSIFRSLTHNNCASLHNTVPTALAQQLERTIQTAEKLGGACIPALDNDARERYVRSVASSSGLIAVTGTIARLSIPMMTEICKGDKTLIAAVGSFERLLLQQLSLADGWKERKTRKKDVDDTDIVMDGVEEGENERTDTEVDAMDIEPDFDLDVAQAEPEAPYQSRSSKRAPDDLAYDVLQQAASTIKNLYTSIAKAIHTPVRRRDESFARPTLCMNAAALGLALVLKQNLEEEIPDIVEHGRHRYAKHMTRLVEEVQSVLFDGRRNCCHTLILNYFVSIQGFAALIRRFEEAVGHLWATLEDRSSQASTSTSQADAEATPMETLIVAFLTLFAQMMNPRLLCQSAQTTSLLVLPLPNKDGTEEEAQDTNGERSEAFVKRLRETVLRSVLPVWSHPLLARSPSGIAGSVVDILNSCMDASGSLSAAFRAIRSDGRYGGGRVNPDPEMIQTIMDMGFSRNRAVHALRRIGQNSVEMALEWLVNHPEETGEQTEAPQERELADAMAASLTQIEAPVEAQSSSEATSDSIRVLDLVTGAVAVLEKSPSSAFSISTFMMTLCNRNEGSDRETILQWFIACLNKSIVPGADFEAMTPRLNAVGHLLALIMSESAQCRELATEVDMVPSLIRALDEWERQYRSPQEIPTWIEGLLLVLDFLSQTQPPSPDASDADEADDEQEKTPLEKILCKWTPSGAIQQTQSVHLVELGIKILKHLHTYGQTWKPPAQHRGLASDPAGVTQAVLQLLASVTRCHHTALKFLNKEGVDLLLSLPASCVLPRLEPYISIILKHVLEDDATLQTLMEGEIKNAFSGQRRPLGQLPFYDWERMPLRTFLQKTSPIAYRSPSIFSKTVANLCVISEANGNSVVCLKRNRTTTKSAEKGTDSAKKNKKVFASFAEVIGKLIDHCARFDFNAISTTKPPPPTTAKASKPGTNAPEAANANNQADNSTQHPSIPRETLMENRDVIMQIMVLDMLSEYCLMYASTVGVLLKRDADGSHRGPSSSTESHGLLKRLIHEHLSWKERDESIQPGIGDEASRLLQAVCLRSSEGRRRVLTEIVEVLRWACSVLPSSPKQSRMASPFVSVPGSPSGTKLRAMIDLIGSLLITGSSQKSGNQGENRQSSIGSGLTIELIRTMRDADVVQVLIDALELVEMNHPDAAKAVHSIIKPLEVLTRSIPAASKKTSPAEVTPPREPRTSRDGTDLMSASPPAPVEMFSGDLMEEDLPDIQDAHLLPHDIPDAEFYEALEDIDGIVDETLQQAMDGAQGDLMDEDDDSESESSSGSQSFHEGASQDDHVVVDEESEEMENEQEELEASEDEDHDEEDEDEMDDHDDDMTADMELEDGDDWDEGPAMREYSEAMDRIEHAMWGEGDEQQLLLTEILANPPNNREFRTIQGYMLGNLFPEAFQAGRRGIRYRLQTRARGNGNNAPLMMPQVHLAQHRLLVRPQQRNGNNEEASNNRMLSDAAGRRFGQIPQGEGRWRQLAFPGARVAERQGMFGVSVMGDRFGDAIAPVYVSSGMQWINTMQQEFEDLLMQTLPREAAPQQPAAPDAQNPQDNAQDAEAPSTNAQPVDASADRIIDNADPQSTVRVVDQILQHMAQRTADVAVEHALADEAEDAMAVDEAPEEVPHAPSPLPAVEPEVVMEAAVAEDGDVMEADEQPAQSEQPAENEAVEEEAEEEETEDALPPEILTEAEAAGIDPTFLQELPKQLQLEVLNQHGVSVTALTQPATGPNEEATALEDGAVDPEFLAALPPDIREEVIESHRMAERRREVERRLTETTGDEMANMIAALPDDIREEVLLYSTPDILATLPSNLLAEGQRFRERQLRHIPRDVDPAHPLAANPFFRRLRQDRQNKDGKKKERKEELEGPPAIDEAGLIRLVSLLKMHAPMIKTQLQKLLLNLCSRTDSRHDVARHLIQIMREPDPEDSRNAASVTRRVLDLLCYLARHPTSKVAETLLDVHVVPSMEAAGKLPMDDLQSNPQALQVLLEMMHQPLCMRSVSTLEQNLTLLELILQSAASKDASDAVPPPPTNLTSMEAAEQPSNSDVPVASSSQTPTAHSSLQRLSATQLALLPSIIGRDGLTERAYKMAASVVKLMAEAAPVHQVFLLQALKAQIQDQTSAACMALNQMSIQGMDRSAMHALNGSGSRTLRLLHSVDALLSAKSQDRDAATDALGGVSQDLEQLWCRLSPIVAEIEKQIKDGAAAVDNSISGKVLPSGAAQILPFIESFFVLCGAHHIQHRSQSLSETLTTFAERHRILLNAFLRQTPTLLEGSFKSLLQYPRLIDFDNKRSYFRSKIRPEERTHYGTLRINVRREHVFEDSFYQLRHRTSDELRCKLSVQFTGEEGIDAGGVSREWYQVMAREIFNPNLALFVAVPDGASTFQPNPSSIIQNDRGVNHVDFFKFVGRLVGKALYDGQLIDAHFTRSFYKHMLNQPLGYQDLEAVDLDFYKQMKWILENDITDVLAGHTFAAEMDFFGKTEVIELKEGGSTQPITESNKKEYVNLMTKHKMTTAIKHQIKAFQEGFWELVPKDLVAIFNDHELELIISGLPEVDVSDLKANTEYTGHERLKHCFMQWDGAGYTAASQVIQWFWSVVEEFDAENLAMLLQFVTGTSKVPLDGFQNLQGISGPQKFQIHKSYASNDRLPSAHTCFNQLDLPEYSSRENLKERLLLAIHEAREGFGFG